MVSVKLLCFVLLVTMLVVIFGTMPYGCSGARVSSCRIQTKTLRLRDVHWSKVFGETVGYLEHKDQTFTISYCSGSCNYSRNPAAVRQYIYNHQTDSLTRALLEHSCSTRTSCIAMKDLRPCCVPVTSGYSNPVVSRLQMQKRTINITFIDGTLIKGYVRNEIPYTFFEPTVCKCS